MTPKPRRRGRPPANASKHEGEEDQAVFTKWCDLIASGRTERYAAIGLPIRYNTLRSWAERDPERREQLADAHETHIQTRLDEMDDAPDAIASSEDGDGVHPKAAELKVRNAQWLLGKLDRDRFGEGKRVEKVGAGGGPIQSEVRITLADALELAKDPAQ